MNNQKPQHLGLRHVALYVKNFDACLHFYIELFGMTVEWQPDEDNYYLTSGYENFALHRAPDDFDDSGRQRLDHIGFILATADTVDEWYNYLIKADVTILKEIKTHRDGARSFYCQDPDGNIVQMIYHPPLSDKA